MRANGPDSNCRARVFCFPFAGGGAAAYRGWEDALGADVDVCAVEIPGRGRRIDEAPIGEMDRLVDALASDLAPLFDRDVYFVGHSMGARIAFALAAHDAVAPRLRALVASASRAPSAPPRRAISALPTPAFLRELKELGGTSPALFHDRELQDLMLPALRADFALSDAYRVPSDATIAAPITAVAARDDAHVAPADVAAWAAHTTARFALVEIASGGHFFVTARRDEMLAVVRRALADR